MKTIIWLFIINTLLFAALMFNAQQLVNYAYQDGYMQGRDDVYSEWQAAPSDGTCYTKDKRC